MSNPNEILQPPEQLEVDQQPPIDEEELRRAATGQSLDPKSSHSVAPGLPKETTGPAGQHSSSSSIGHGVSRQSSRQPNGPPSSQPPRRPSSSATRQPPRNSSPQAAGQSNGYASNQPGQPGQVSGVSGQPGQHSGQASRQITRTETSNGTPATKTSSKISSSKNTDDVSERTEDLTPSEDFDMSDVKSKPKPRQPVEPSFRGWKEVGGWGEGDALTADDEAEDLLERSTIFDQYLPQVAYGDWYHNVAYLIVAGLLSWIFGWFRFSLAPVFFVMVSISLLYRTSIRRYRSNLRELAQREFSIKAIEDDYETLDWMNVFLEKFWYFLEPSISQIVCDQVNPILAASPAPAFIKQLWIDSFTAGTKPPRIDCVKTLPGTDSDIVVMDWACSFTPNSLADSNNKQLKNKVNQKIVVKANLFGIPIPVAVSDVSFMVVVRIRLRMMTSFPHVETVNVSLMEPPHFDFNSKVLFGDNIFNWEVLSIPGLYPFIHDMIKKYVGAMLFAPMSFQLNLQQLMAGNALDASIGILAITVKSASGIKGHTAMGNTIDPYVSVGFKKDVLAKTGHKANTTKPTWNEILYIPVKSLSEPLVLTLDDYNHHHKDRAIGTIQFDLEALYKNSKQPDLSGTVTRNNKPVGELKFGLNYMPTLEAVRQVDGAVVPPPDLNTGIARIEIGGARHLKGDSKKISTYAELYINGKLKVTTPVQKGTNAPNWAISHEEIIGNRSKAKVRVVLKNKDGKPVGQVFSSLNNFIDSTQVEENWFPLAKGGEISITTGWKPVGLTDAAGSGGYTAPIGVVRVSVERAEDLRNLETIGTVDPYARILVNGFERSRTAVADSTLNPTWNEVHYVTVASANQKLTIDVMDVESHSPDRTLGSFDVKLNEIINKNEKGKYIEWEDDLKRESKLIHKKGPKGTVTYSLSFYPTLPVKTLEDIKDEEEAAKQDKRRKEKEDAKKRKEEEANGTSKDEKKAVPNEVSDEEEQEKKDDAGLEDIEDVNEESGSNAKVQLSLDQLLEYNSGVFVFELIDGTVSKDDVYLHVYFDNHGTHDYVSQKFTKKQMKIGQTGDAVIKELDWSKACFRLSKGKDDNRLEKCIAETTIPTLQLVKNGYHEPTTIQLSGAGTGSFKIHAQWIPVLYANSIPPQDSVNNSGILHVTTVRAEGLMAADRSGKSDPYVKLYLNTDKDEFFKSKKVKKTLEPTWNEDSSVEVANLYDSILKVDCFDWDMGPEQDDFLGVGYVKLSDVDPKNNHEEIACKLTTDTGDDGGVVYFKFNFKPEFILTVRPLEGTHIGDALGAVGGVGKGVVGGVGKGVGKGLGGGASLFKKGLHLGRSSEKDE
ncbi:tricalbin-1 [[Candida] anglica]|uniref:Tricalbin-1 n=1 Tax=[Candida] anglica TaxID=148631 RepID=A0ABP0EGE6_9ASCO